MNTKPTLFICVLITLCKQSPAQNVRFFNEGIIEYERSINTYAVLRRIVKGDQNAFKLEQYEYFKKTYPQFRTLQSTLMFSKGKTLFEPLENQQLYIPFFGDSPELSQINTVYSDLNKNQKVTRKKIYNDFFLLKDNIKPINWKITGETREIAGYECQRANAIIMDSVYVVAFYTDEIPVSGGPESFGGLPGMILGLALPHDNVTWFAKTVRDKAIEAKLMTEPTGGKTINLNDLISKLSSALKGYGNYAQTMIKAFLI